MELWPGKPPGQTTDQKESLLADRGDGTTRLTNVSRPTLTIWQVDPTQSKGNPTAAVLVCPGGGYRYLAIDKEGTAVAQWLNSLGIAAAVLKYRTPNNRAGALQDAQRAVGLLRQQVRQWNIDPKRLGAIGFSAGGHLVARLSTDYSKRAYAPVDEADRLSCRPDFAMLVYPAYLSKKQPQYTTADELVVNDKTPPTWIVQTQDDHKYVDSSIAYYLALKKAKVAAELHLFTTGGHGFGLGGQGHPVICWPRLCAAWLQDLGMVDKPAEPAKQ